MEIDTGQLEFVDQMLRDILAFIEEETGFTFTITSLFRIGDSGVHGTLPLRGADVRCRDVIAGQMIEQMVNGIWKYDPKRVSKKCAYLHGEGSNLHLHIQVHPNTIKT